MLPLVSARLIARAARRHQELRLDAAVFRRSRATLERALAGGAHLTRAELAAVLRAGGVVADGPRLSHLLGHAELEGVICGGPPRAKQATWMLLAHRVPGAAAPLARDEGIAELARRYFQSRGPATAADFAWWSGLQPADARAGLAAVRGELTSETIDSVTYWRDGALPGPSSAAVARAYLLPPFDEYLIAYRDRAAVIDTRHLRRLNAGGGMLAPCLLLDGRVVGTWRRVLTATQVEITLAPFDPPPPAARATLESAAERYAAFLCRPATVSWRPFSAQTVGRRERRPRHSA
jgi:hypothetical protein